MKQELFNIGEYEGIYEDIDRLDYRKLEDLNGDNLFFAFLKENEEVTLNCVAAINHKIYNFNTHKFIGDNVEITFDNKPYMVKSSLDNMGIVEITIEGSEFCL